MPPSPRDSSDRSPAPPPFPRPSAPSSIGCINASSTTSINSFTPWASRSPHESRPEHRTSQREQNPRYRPHNGLSMTRRYDRNHRAVLEDQAGLNVVVLAHATSDQPARHRQRVLARS